VRRPIVQIYYTIMQRYYYADMESVVTSIAQTAHSQYPSVQDSNSLTHSHQVWHQPQQLGNSHQHHRQKHTDSLTDHMTHGTSTWKVVETILRLVGCTYHQSQTVEAWLNIVPLGQRNETLLRRSGTPGLSRHK
jgi:hypothetical protein